MNIGMILSGGSGQRFGSKIPKQYNMLMGKEVIGYSVDALKNAARLDQVIIVADPDSVSTLHTRYGVDCIAGGASRNDSLRRGLDYIKMTYPGCRNIFITEAARPFLTADLTDAYVDWLDEYDAVITTKHITDSLGRNGEPVTLRDEYYLIQAPEAFRFSLLEEYFRADSPITATVQQLPAERNVLNYFEFKNNLKITYPEDLMMAEYIMKSRREGENHREI